MRRLLLQSVATWLLIATATVEAAPLLFGFVDGFRNRFQWRVYADVAPDNPHATPGEFTYVYWQQAIGGEIPLYNIQLTDGTLNELATLSATGIVPFTGAEPTTISTGSWSWSDFTLMQGQRTSSLYVTSPHPPGQIGALVYNCNPIICDIGTTATIGPVNPSPPLGDYDLGGSVGPEDYAIWKAAFGTSSYAADGNQDGVVNAADYTLWRDHLGTSSSAAELIFSAVPEPASGLLLVLGAAFSLVAGRRTPRVH